MSKLINYHGTAAFVNQELLKDLSKFQDIENSIQEAAAEMEESDSALHAHQDMKDASLEHLIEIEDHKIPERRKLSERLWYVKKAKQFVDKAERLGVIQEDILQRKIEEFKHSVFNAKRKAVLEMLRITTGKKAYTTERRWRKIWDRSTSV